ncbi:Uncharacterised protein [uncultured archaeon]|nr:Uncharacterised protein [uncultured archaeon]
MGFIDDALAKILTQSLMELKNTNPESYKMTKEAIKSTADVLSGIATCLADDNITAAELQSILSKIADKGAYRAVISVITSILGHVKG